MKTWTRFRAIIDRRTRRMSSSLLPLNMTPAMTSIQPPAWWNGPLTTGRDPWVARREIDLADHRGSSDPEDPLSIYPADHCSGAADPDLRRLGPFVPLADRARAAAHGPARLRALRHRVRFRRGHAPRDPFPPALRHGVP